MIKHGIEMCSITGVWIYSTTSQNWTITNITKAIVFSQSDPNTLVTVPVLSDILNSIYNAVSWAQDLHLHPKHEQATTV